MNHANKPENLSYFHFNVRSLGKNKHKLDDCFLVTEVNPTFFSLLVVRRFDDGAAQRVSLCRRMWLLSPKTEAQTRPHTVQADPCRVVVGCGWLR